MISYTSGDILKANAEALVNTVNCVGVMGRGIALQFKNAFPDAFKANVHIPPIGHFGDAEMEIGRVCVQLASPDFKYMTGETITLEGGLGQRP